MDSLYNGKGALTMSFGEILDGIRANGKMHGRGDMIIPNFMCYEGEWSDDKMNGNGIYTQLNGSRYEGEFVNNSINGYGTEYAPDGAIIHQSQWKNGDFVGTK